MNYKIVLTAMAFLFAVALSGCGGYYAAGYSDYPHGYGYYGYPYGSYSSRYYDRDDFHHRHDHHDHHDGGRYERHEGWR